MPQLGGFPSEQRHPVWHREKLEWLGYQTVKNFEDIFICFGATHERDGQTDGHRMPVYTALMHMHRAVKSKPLY